MHAIMANNVLCVRGLAVVSVWLLMASVAADIPCKP